eukprot:3594502-Pleurochrysis_carterae.AAC.1
MARASPSVFVSVRACSCSLLARALGGVTHRLFCLLMRKSVTLSRVIRKQPASSTASLAF